MVMVVWWQIVWMIGLGAGAALVAYLLRHATRSGAPILSGLMVGLLLGPGVAGRVVPGWYEDAILGGQAERIAYERAVAARRGAMMAADYLGEGVAVEDYEQLIAAERAALQSWDTATLTHQQWVRWSTYGLILLSLIGTPRVRSRRQETTGHPLAALCIGLWMSLITGSTTAVLLLWTGVDLEAALFAGAIVAIGPHSMHPRDARIADGSITGGYGLMRAAGVIATVVALVTMCGLLVVGPSPFFWLPAAVLGCVLLGRILSPVRSRSLRCAMQFIILPWLVALAAARIEFILHFALWPVVILTLFSGDGRWMSATIGAWTILGGSLFRAMRLTMAVMSAGPMQIAITAACIHARILPESLALGLLLGAGYLDSTTRFRQRMAQELAHLEQELPDSNRH